MHMKLVAQKTYGRITADLAARLQPMIEEAAHASGQPRMDIQAALWKQLENSQARIGVATAARLLKDPASLVSKYHQAKQIALGQANLNFEHTLNSMIAHSARAHTTKTLTFIKQNFAHCKSFKELRRIVDLHAENGGRPLTLVKLKQPLPAEHPATERVASRFVLLKDGEALAVSTAGIVYGPTTKEALPKLLQKEGYDASTGWVTDVRSETADFGYIHSTPEPPQSILPGLL